MNGTNGIKKGPASPSQAWTQLSKYLPPVNSDQDFWWQLTGRHVASLVEAAGYSMEKQYEALVFHYHWTVSQRIKYIATWSTSCRANTNLSHKTQVPYMGPAPNAEGKPTKWSSLLGLDGSPIEYSWKWETKTSEPDVRYVTEPIGAHPGTHIDPLNQQALRELLQRLADSQGTDMNLGWVNHFFARYYDHDNSKYVQEAAAGSARSTATSVQLGTEFLRNKGIGFKTYFFPRKLGRVDDISVGQYDLAMAELEVADESQDTWAARKALVDFLAHNAEGRAMKPFSIAVDNVAPTKSRLKWYFHTPHTSFRSVREVMTLGGRIVNDKIEGQLADLYALIRAVAGLPDDFPDTAEIPLPVQSDVYDQAARDNFGELDEVLTGYLYYFDVAPGGKELPEIKWFIPSRHYAPNDLAHAYSVAAWMEARGRGSHNQQYMKMLGALSQHRGLETAKGLQTFVSCLFKADGELDITTYLGAEAYHPARAAQGVKRRSLLRRGDSF
jgi:DMATS type aromatic prenyltransferase